MVDSGIKFFNRYTGEVETEEVYGERWLRWILFNPFGQVALHAVAKRAWFSRWYGGRMSHPRSVVKVKPFIELQKEIRKHLAEQEASVRLPTYYKKLREGAGVKVTLGD